VRCLRGLRIRNTVWNFVCERIFGLSAGACATNPFNRVLTGRDAINAVVGTLALLALRWSSKDVSTPVSCCVRKEYWQGATDFYGTGSILAESASSAVTADVEGALAVGAEEQGADDLEACLAGMISSFKPDTPVLMADGTTKADQ